MNGQKFCLTWKDYNNVFNKEFDSSRKAGDFFDVTLACEDHEISAHKLVLSASSDFFKALLRRHKHDHPLIYLKGVKFHDLQAILDFIYTGETEVSEANLETLLAIGGELRIKGLTEGQGDEGSVVDGSVAANMGLKQYTTQTTHFDKLKMNKPRPVNTVRKTTTGYITMTGANNQQQMMEIKTEDGTINDQIDISRFLSSEPVAQTEVVTAGPAAPVTSQATAATFKYPLATQNQTESQIQLSNECELNRQVSELMVSSYDPVLGKTIWQCAQCHYSSKLRYTVKEHVETHISGFSHQCPMCSKTCKTRNALRVHTIRKHSQPKVQSQPQTSVLPQTVTITTQQSPGVAGPVSVAVAAPVQQGPPQGSVVPLALPLPLTVAPQLSLPRHPHPQAQQQNSQPQHQVRQMVAVQASHQAPQQHQASPHHQPEQAL